MKYKLLQLFPTEIGQFYINNRNEKNIKEKLDSILIFTIFLGVFAIAFLGLTDYMSDNKLVSFDDFITSNIISFRSKNLSLIMKYITTLGDTFGYLALCVILWFLFYLKKNWRFSLQITLILILASGLNVLLKNVISRPRPLINRIVYANFYSFPSGHAMSAVVFYGFISYLSIILLQKKWHKVIAIAFCMGMVILIGISRIYLGVHYPSDILAGYLAGLSWLMFCLIILNIMTLRKIRLSKNK